MLKVNTFGNYWFVLVSLFIILQNNNYTHEINMHIEYILKIE